VKKFKNLVINTLLVIISTSIVLFFLNIFTIYNLKQSNKFFNSAVSAYSKNYMSNLQKAFFPDTYKSLEDNYIVLLGDSNTYGNGDSHLNGDYDYSIAHHLYKKNINVLNASKPGNDTLRAVLYTLYLYDLIENSYFVKVNEPNKIIFFLYEGNDIQVNSNDLYVKNFDKDSCKIKQTNLSLLDRVWESNFYGLKTLYMTLKHQLNLDVQFGNMVSILKLILPENTYKYLESKFGNKYEYKPDNANQILLKNNKINNIGILQKPPHDLSNKEINKYFDILENSLKCLHDRFKTEEKYLVYMPSPGSLYNFNHEDLAFDHDEKKSYKKANIKKLRELSNFFEKNIKSISIKNQFKFHSLKNDLKKVAKNQMIHGYLDPHHFNYLGYKTIADSLLKNIF